MKNLTILFCLISFYTTAQNQNNNPSNPQKSSNEFNVPDSKPQIVRNAEVISVGSSNGFVTPVMIQPNGGQFVDSKTYFQRVGQEQMPLINSSGNSKIGFNSYEYKGEFILVELGGYYGVLDKFGEKILPIIYKEIKLPNTDKGLFAVKKGKKWGYVSRSNKVIIPMNFEDATAFDEYNIGILTQNTISRKVDAKGKILN